VRGRGPCRAGGAAATRRDADREPGAGGAASTTRDAGRGPGAASTTRRRRTGGAPATSRGRRAACAPATTCERRAGGNGSGARGTAGAASSGLDVGRGPSAGGATSCCPSSLQVNPDLECLYFPLILIEMDLYDELDVICRDD
jgi:hypothetical protein